MTLITPEVIESLVSFEEIADAARLVAADLDTGRWILGDITNRCLRVYGEDSVGRLAAELRMAKAQTLRDYARTARAFPPALRNAYQDAPISFTHFRTAAVEADTPEKAEYWLAQAADNLWSVAELRKQMGRTKAPVKLYDGAGVVWQYANESRPYLVLSDDVSALVQGLAVTIKVYEAEAQS